MKDHRYVVTYHYVKHRFGNSINVLKKHAFTRGVHGTAVFYHIRDDGSWERISLEGEKNEN